MKCMISAGALCATVLLGWSHTLEAADPSVTREIESAELYLPVYKSGAEYAGDSEDRVRDARDEFELWKMAERNEIVKAGSDKRRLGERSVNKRLSAIQEDLKLSDEEFNDFLQRSNAESPHIPDKSRLKPGKSALNKPLIQPIYTELAHLCAAPGAVVIYVAEAGNDQPALAQYESATKLDADELTNEITSAWRLGVGEDAHGYAWQDPQSPEVLAVAVSTAHTCGFDQMVEQVGIERVE